MANRTRMAMSPQLAAMLAAAAEHADHRRRVARLSAALLQRMYINPHGINAVCFLADSRHRSNETAMRAWVSDQLDDPAFEGDVTISNELDALLARLRALFTGMDPSNDF